MHADIFFSIFFFPSLPFLFFSELSVTVPQIVPSHAIFHQLYLLFFAFGNYPGQWGPGEPSTNASAKKRSVQTLVRDGWREVQKYNREVEEVQLEAMHGLQRVRDSGADPSAAMRIVVSSSRGDRLGNKMCVAEPKVRRVR